jgi:hypothetical protein
MPDPDQDDWREREVREAYFDELDREPYEPNPYDGTYSED